jgi:hypothetical protein
MATVQFPLFNATAEFVRGRWQLVTASSAAVLLPCFWHKHIEAGDLGSHVYNAWLVQLIHRGQLPGLWIARQWNNVAFDLLLSGFGKIFSWVWAEKLAVSICVLIFFWGVFALVSAATRRAPVFLLPLIAVISYGWTFQQGFMNFYLSLGLSFFALAILWRGNQQERIAALALVPFIVLAHPLGLMWLFGVAIYALAVEKFQRYSILPFTAGTLIVVSISVYIQHHYLVYPARHALYLYNGADQIVLFSRAYELLALAIFLPVMIALALELYGRRHDAGVRQSSNLLLQLYFILQVLVLALPYGVLLPGYNAPLSFLPHRLTTLSAVLICCLLGLMQPRKWHLVTYAVAAAMFFSLLYRDTGIINSLEDQSERLVSTLPFGQRVVFTIKDRGLRLFIEHFADRSCIQRCFSYGNYEPSTKQFRVRAAPGNGVVMTDFAQVTRMEDGEYEVSTNDPPMFEIFQCGPKGRELCGRSLVAGEKNTAPSPGGSPFAER